MKINKRFISVVSGVFILLSFNAPVSATHLKHQFENPLPVWERAGNKTIDFTDVDIELMLGRATKRSVEDSIFTAQSSSTSVFSLNSILDGYDNIEFQGVLVLNAILNSKGMIQPGSTYAVYSSDVVFGTQYTESYNCNKSGKNCSTGQLVYGGNITQFGWDQKLGVLEFATADLTGWAKDNWAPLANSPEHILFNVDCSTQTSTDSTLCFDIMHLSNNEPFVAQANGFAVVPDAEAILVER